MINILISLLSKKKFNLIQIILSFLPLSELNVKKYKLIKWFISWNPYLKARIFINYLYCFS